MPVLPGPQFLGTGQLTAELALLLAPTQGTRRAYERKKRRKSILNSNLSRGILVPLSFLLGLAMMGKDPAHIQEVGALCCFNRSFHHRQGEDALGEHNLVLEKFPAGFSGEVPLKGTLRLRPVYGEESKTYLGRQTVTWRCSGRERMGDSVDLGRLAGLSLHSGACDNEVCRLMKLVLWRTEYCHWEFHSCSISFFFFFFL